MLIFIDTEFTSLREPYLISAAFVAADGRELYFELAGITPSICSHFVRAHVLPLLDGPVVQPIEAAEQVAAFLSAYAGDVTFFTDAPLYDIELIRPFLPQNLRLAVAVPSFDTEADEAAFVARHQAQFARGLRRHHALDDARALRGAWNKQSIQETAETR